MASSLRRPRGMPFANAWVTYLLLGLGIVAPVVCVVWLVRKTVENEEAQVQRLLLEADQRSLVDAEEKLLEALAAGQANPAVARFVEDRRFIDPDEVAKAKGSLASLRKSVAEQNGLDAQETYARYLLSEEASLRLQGGRFAGGIALELAFETVAENGPFSDTFLQSVDLFLLRLTEEDALQSQLRYLLRKYSAFSENERIRELATKQEILSEWENALRELDAFPPVPGYGLVEDFAYFRDAGVGTAFVYRESELLRLASDLFSGELASVRLVKSSRESRAEEKGEEEILRRRLPGALETFVLEIPLHSKRADLPQPKGNVYVWIGAIVLGLSLVSGGAIIYSLRRQASVTQLKDNLIATVTHELKTPVASVRLLVDTLLDEQRKGKIDTQEYLEMISRENQRLGRLIDNFLSFSRMERKMGSFSIQATDPASLLEEAVEAFRERFQGHEFQLETELDTELPDIAADREAMVTVLGNLLENAFKYGGDPKWIGARVRAEASGICFEVEDRGRGIARKDQKRVFRKFYQTSPNESEHAGSVGLGLSIVEFIVSKHSGQVDVSSELGVGSTFTVRIPYA